MAVDQALQPRPSISADRRRRRSWPALLTFVLTVVIVGIETVSSAGALTLRRAIGAVFSRRSASSSAAWRRADPARPAAVRLIAGCGVDRRLLPLLLALAATAGHRGAVPSTIRSSTGPSCSLRLRSSIRAATRAAARARRRSGAGQRERARWTRSPRSVQRLRAGSARADRRSPSSCRSCPSADAPGVVDIGDPGADLRDARLGPQHRGRPRRPARSRLRRLLRGRRLHLRHAVGRISAVSFWVCLPLAGLLAAPFGVLLGFPVLRCAATISPSSRSASAR